jgi:hypothetical protein
MRLVSLLFTLGLHSFLGFVARAESPRIAILGFSGDSRNQSIVAGAFTSVTSSRLVNSGKFEVVKPELTERAVAAGGGVGALASASAVSEFGKSLGCQYVVYGSVLNADVATNRFSGYGVTTFKTVFGLRVDFKILNVFDGRVVFSRILEDSETKVNLDNPDGFSAALFTEMSKRAVNGLESTMLVSLERNIREGALALEKFLGDGPGKAQTGSASAAVKHVSGERTAVLKFDCSVPSASVEVDGVIEGVCSDSISVSLGLHEISITARNYEAFKTKVRITKDTVIPVELKQNRVSKK